MSVFRARLATVSHARSTRDTQSISEKRIAGGNSASLGGERFIAQHLESGAWSVLDRRYREPVGPPSASHEHAERRAAALNVANARLRADGRHLTRSERDEID